jgi:hypothetical protein
MLLVLSLSGLKLIFIPESKEIKNGVVIEKTRIQQSGFFEKSNLFNVTIKVEDTVFTIDDIDVYNSVEKGDTIKTEISSYEKFLVIDAREEIKVLK